MNSRTIWALVGLASLFAFTACSGDPGPEPTEPPPASAGATETENTSTSSPDPGEESTRSAEPTQTAATRPAGDELAFQVWFYRDGRLAVTNRTEPSTQAVARAAVEALLAGPTRAELDAGMSTRIPGEVDKAAISLEGGVATIDLPSSYYAGDGKTRQFRHAQVVLTLSQYPTIDAVQFEDSGEPSGSPLRPADFDGMLPAITVSSPTIGVEVGSPVRVVGTAIAFEATVQIRVLDAGGRELASTYTMADCGNGCRGEYAHQVEFSVDKAQAGVVEVFEESAVDGSPTHLVRIPVTLLPG